MTAYCKNTLFSLALKTTFLYFSVSSIVAVCWCWFARIGSTLQNLPEEVGPRGEYCVYENGNFQIYSKMCVYDILGMLVGAEDVFVQVSKCSAKVIQK